MNALDSSQREIISYRAASGTYRGILNSVTRHICYERLRRNDPITSREWRKRLFDVTCYQDRVKLL